MAITMPTNQIIDIRGSPRESNVGFAIYFLTILLIVNVKDARRDLNGLWPADSNGKRGGQKKEERRELSGSGGSQHTCRILVREPLRSIQIEKIVLFFCRINGQYVLYNLGIVQDGTSPRKSASDLRLPESQDSMAQKFKVSSKKSTTMH